ncbi:MAG TPA: radical SAM protein [Fervidobacterium sp.]|nr:radical SAM protein [Fervidobacterium sp.]HPT58890.1 radical SAM protein [Fervidobacterium sp.]
MNRRGKRKIYPVFLPNAGCKTRCVFCNQIIMTGETIPNIAELESIDFSNVDEIAFYGGTFTGLNKDAMKRLLMISPDIPKRISTRPDSIDEETIALLKDWNVQVIELGIESLDDGVLECSKRGYKAEEALKTIEHLKDEFEIIAHLMIGLPNDTRQKDIRTVQLLLDSGIRVFRIHPTLVFKNTELEDMYRDGLYTPLNLVDAIDTVAEMVALIECNNGQVTRLGYHVPQSQMEYLIAGPYHDAFGDVVRSTLIRKIIEELHIKKVTYSTKYKPWFYAHGNAGLLVERQEIEDVDNSDVLLFDELSYAQSLELLINRLERNPRIEVI